MSPATFSAISMIVYFVGMVVIGWWAYGRNDSLDDYMLADRGLGPAVTALSAGAADMSGWLLMGLPGALYAGGLVESWIAVGLTVGAWLNWRFVAPRLRTYTEVASNSITIRVSSTIVSMIRCICCAGPVVRSSWCSSPSTSPPAWSRAVPSSSPPSAWTIGWV